MTSPLDRDLEAARAKRDARLRKEEEWRQRNVAERQAALRAQEELREAVKAFLARARELEIEPISMPFRDKQVERKVGFFSSKTEKVWQYREARGWHVQVGVPGDSYGGHGHVASIAVTTDGDVHHESWHYELSLTDPGAPDMPYTGGGFQFALSESRRAMAEYLVRHGG